MPSHAAIPPATMVLRAVLYLLLILCTGTSVFAQEFGRMNEQIASGTAYRVFARPGEATVQVVVVAASGSGVYEVAPDTDLGALVALTGGLETTERRANSRSRVTVQLLREQDGVRRAVYEAPLEQMLLEPGKHPELLEGDVLTVESVSKQRFNWRDVLSITTALATISWTLRGIIAGN